jgi:hypothetical protein
MNQPSPIRHLEVDLTQAETQALYDHLNEWASVENLPLKRKLRAAIVLSGGPKDIPADEVLSHALNHARSVIKRLPASPQPIQEPDSSKSGV